MWLPMDGPLPPDDGFEPQEEPHTEGNRMVVNEVSAEGADEVLRERVGPVEDHGDGEHNNVNISLENPETGASKEIGNEHG